MDRNRASAWLLFFLITLIVTPGSVPASVDSVAEPLFSTGEPEWLSRAQKGIAEREYEASHNGEGLQAPNRQHGFRTYFEASRIRVCDRTAPESPELLSLSLVGVGRGESLVAVPPGNVVAEGARIEIRRSTLIEWYVNSPMGLEQGFTLLERPKGKGALALELAVGGATASLDGGRVVFATVVGRRLAYGKLAVVDATGRELRARLEVPNTGR